MGVVVLQPTANSAAITKVMIKRASMGLCERIFILLCTLFLVLIWIGYIVRPANLEGDKIVYILTSFLAIKLMAGGQL